jgi:hypothetical protein
MKPQARIKENNGRAPLILLVDPRNPQEGSKLTDWLSSHAFSSYEASDTFDAISQILDFTTARVPEIVTIPGMGQQDLMTVSQLLHSFVGADYDLDIFLYSNERNAPARSISTEQLGQLLQFGRDRDRI